MTYQRSRKSEFIIYTSIWITIVGVFMLQAMRSNASHGNPLIDLQLILRTIRIVIPFLLLFLINNHILIPQLLLRNRLTTYLILTASLILLIWSWQSYDFLSSAGEQMPPPPRPGQTPADRPLLPLPIFLDFIYDLLITGGNIAVALISRRNDDKFEKERLLKANAENRLAYLKVQINPHFYMNMLNNIHGMIEIDPEKAQTMVIEMSQLMRFMLYESSQSVIPLSKEIDFITNYLNLMRHRFPSSLVKISSKLPDPGETSGIFLPPLLFLVLIENAFKHGVSYQKESFVNILLTVTDNQLTFSCTNSNHAAAAETATASAKEQSGIGLTNIRQRLNLLYGDRATLQLDKTQSTFTATLTIPTR